MMSPPLCSRIAMAHIAIRDKSRNPITARDRQFLYQPKKTAVNKIAATAVRTALMSP